MKNFLLIVMSVLVLGGCVSKTMINTYPQGAKVSIDGQILGVSPVQYEDKAVSGHQVNVTFQKIGYKDKSATITKNDIYIHRFFAPPLLALPWLMGYKEQYTFEMERDEPAFINAVKEGKLPPILDKDHVDKIFITSEQLPLSLKYNTLGPLQVGEEWYGSQDIALQALANEARRIGANAVIEVKTWHQPSGKSWAAPHGSGIAIVITNPSEVDFSKLTGLWK